MEESTPNSLLWIDDDAPGRFRYEHQMLTQRGWQITWAKCAEEAADLLRREVFRAIILDQMFPWSKQSPGTDTDEVWAGCFLLFWLRDKGRPSKAPPREPFDSLFTETKAPLPSNRTIPVVLSSAYFDEDISASIFDIEPHIPELPKPIDLERLLELFSQFVS
ncbi:MAG TPA: hypothetical protein VGM86_33415 [Thermoanaerobaculia bacterium]|jgi:CheY-like chemotaxis protein